MTVGFSTSSPLVSVAVFDRDGALLASGEHEAPRAASGVALDLLNRLLNDADRSLSDVRLFVADLGPGGFTSVRVGVTLAKTLAYAVGAQVAGAMAFDLIDPGATVTVGATKGSVFVRRPGEAPVRGEGDPPEGAVGYGPGVTKPVYPHAARFAALLPRLYPVAPVELLPTYLAEPSISQPKSPFRVAPSHG